MGNELITVLVIGGLLGFMVLGVPIRQMGVSMMTYLLGSGA